MFILEIFVCLYCFPVGRVDTARLGCIAQCCYLSFRRRSSSRRGEESSFCVSANASSVYKLCHTWTELHCRNCLLIGWSIIGISVNVPGNVLIVNSWSGWCYVAWWCVTVPSAVWRIRITSLLQIEWNLKVFCLRCNVCMRLCFLYDFLVCVPFCLWYFYINRWPPG